VSELPGRRNDKGKWRFSLFPFDALRAVANVLEHGARKYAEWNWLDIPDSRERCLNSLMRHTFAWWQGETWDFGTPEEPGTGERHLACMACNVIFLLTLEIRGKIDSEPRVQPDWWRAVGDRSPTA